MPDAATTERRLLGLLGLGFRGRLAVVGVEQVRVAAQRGALKLAIVAVDAAANSVKKVVPLLEAKRIPFVTGPTAATLGAALGRRPTADVGIVDRNLARGILEIEGLGSIRARKEGLV
jgi:ribosomal protein L7Ae-like RNA K-turn-binding protein